MAVGVVDQILHGDIQVIPGVFMGRVDIVVDGDEPDAVGREDPAQVAPGLDVLTPQAGQVLDDNAVDPALHDVLHHLLERRTVKQDAAVPIIHLLGYQLDVWMAFQIVLDELFLVGNAVALILVVFRVGKPQIFCRLVFWHKKIHSFKFTDLPHKSKSDSDLPM